MQETQEYTKEQTTIDKAESFALSLAAALTIDNALKEAKELPIATRKRVEETIYKAIMSAPTSFYAEA